MNNKILIMKNKEQLIESRQKVHKLNIQKIQNETDVYSFFTILGEQNSKKRLQFGKMFEI